MADTLILVRHGEVEGSRAGRLLGSTDVPLSEAGRRQAAAAGEALGGLIRSRHRLQPAAARARDRRDHDGRPRRAVTAVAGRPLRRRAGLEIDPDLREIDFGAWEGLTYAEVEKADPAGAEAWSEFAADFVFPGRREPGRFQRARRPGGAEPRGQGEPAPWSAWLTEGSSGRSSATSSACLCGTTCCSRSPRDR